MSLRAGITYSERGDGQGFPIIFSVLRREAPEAIESPVAKARDIEMWSQMLRMEICFADLHWNILEFSNAVNFASHRVSSSASESLKLERSGT